MNPRPAPAPSDDRSDAELLAAHNAGDVYAFAVLFRRYRNLLKATAVEILRNGHDADDAVQEAMLRAVRHLHTLHNPATLPGWLKTLTARAAIDQFAKRRLTERRSAAASPEVFAEESRASAMDDPYAVTDLGLALVNALDQLSSDLAYTWFQVVVLDKPPAEIAAALGIAPGTVKSRISRAGTQIRAILSETLWGSDEPPQAQPPHAGR